MYLTKSRFKIGLSCPTKLYYDSFPKDYHNNDEGNEFMQALAKGGLQVGELAKLYFPGGIEIDGESKQKQLEQTKSALKKENVILYEAALLVDHKFIRIDILKKEGKNIKIFEVKSKSCNGNDELQFRNKKNKIKSSERAYLEDVSFQFIVVSNAFPSYNITPYLMMPNKQIECSINGLYSNFIIKKENSRDTCKVIEGTVLNDLGNKIMSAINVKESVQHLINDIFYKEHRDFKGKSFSEIISWFEDLLIGYENNLSTYFSPPFLKCRDCEYKLADKSKSGYHNCMKNMNKWNDSDFKKPLAWEVWGSPNLKELLSQNKWFMDQIHISDLPSGNRYARQNMQIKNTINKSKNSIIDINGLKSEIESFKFPLNFIDFETSSPAIPFFSGYRPYEGLCFQFSHHILYEDGTVEHKNEFLGVGRGVNPSFDFIDSLYQALTNNLGDIFMYSHHENTYLNYMIKLLLKNSPFSKDKTSELILFLQSITTPSKDITPKWKVGNRQMIDMAEMVRSYYWHPEMKGSNSIKQVLPAIMNDSNFIKDKYSSPIYGVDNKIISKNFKNHTWVNFDINNRVINPYEDLPDLDYIVPNGLRKSENLYSNNKLADGGAAMIAWAFMQFGEMKDHEIESLSKALKRYCELDTMAMVLIMEAWIDFVK